MSDWLKKLASAIKGKSNWVDILTGSPLFAGHKLALNDILPLISKELKRSHVGAAIALGRIVGYKDFSKFIREIRRNGVLRPSKYAFETDSIRKFINAILADEVIFGILPVDKEYLLSVLNILLLADEIRVLKLNLIRQLRPKSYRVLKTLLVYVDRAFFPISEEQFDFYHQNNSILSEPNGQSVESLAAGFSALLAMFSKSFQMSDKYTFPADEDLINSGMADEILQLGVQFSELMDAEILIDAFPFFAKSDGNNVIIEASDPLLEKSIRLGYVQTNLQMLSRHKNTLGNALKLEDFVKILCDKYSSLFIELKHEPMKRYVINLPLIEPFIEFLKSNALFQDEMNYLYEISIDNFLKFDSLLNVTIDDGITIMDLVRVRRLHKVLARMFSEAIGNHPRLFDLDKIDIFSRVPVMHIDQILDFFNILFGENKYRNILNLLIYKVGSESYFDLQYKPIIQFKDYVMFSLGVLENTNIVRNIFCERSFSIANSLSSDPMQNAIEYALAVHGLRIKSGKKGRFQGKEIEIDLLVYAEERLLIIECKNSYHPCSPHEMRTSFDHIRKAATQLTRAREWLKNESAQKEVFIKLGWGNLNVKSIHTCILTANRLFNGFLIDNHPVRHAHELLNLLGSGEIRVDDDFYNIKRGDDFAIDDLIDYLEGKNITSIQIESMTPIEFSTNIGNFSLIRKSYAFDVLRMKELVAENYKPITKEQYDKNMLEKNLAPANISDDTIFTIT